MGRVISISRENEVEAGLIYQKLLQQDSKVKRTEVLICLPNLSIFINKIYYKCIYKYNIKIQRLIPLNIRN